MSDEHAILAAIWEHPHDDTPRLVYADRLEEAGDPVRVARAEFIRVQCELARCGEDDPRREKLVRRERHLWNMYGKAFRRGLPDHLRASSFSRGFVAPRFREVTGHKLFNVLAPIMGHAPLWELQLRALGPEDAQQLFAKGLIERVGALEMSWTGRFPAELLASHQARHLTTLHWDYGFPGINGLRALCGRDAVPHLSSLRIVGGGIVDDGAALLGQSDLASRLTRLHLTSTGLTAAAVRLLAGPGRLVSLESLTLNYLTPGEAVVAELIAHARLPALRHLSLVWSRLSPAGAEALANWPGAATLRHLDLSWNVEMRAAGLRLLLGSPYLRELRVLDVTPLTAEQELVTQLLRERFGDVSQKPGSREHTLRATRPT